VDGGRERVEKSLVGVGRKIDGNLCARRHGARHFDIQGDLAVGAIWIAGRLIGSAIHIHFHNRGRRQSELAEISL